MLLYRKQVALDAYKTFCKMSEVKENMEKEVMAHHVADCASVVFTDRSLQNSLMFSLILKRCAHEKNTEDEFIERLEEFLNASPVKEITRTQVKALLDSCKNGDEEAEIFQEAASALNVDITAIKDLTRAFVKFNQGHEELAGCITAIGFDVIDDFKEETSNPKELD